MTSHRIMFLHPSDELYGSDRCLIETVRSLPEGSDALILLPVDLPYRGQLGSELRSLGADVRYVDLFVARRRTLRPHRSLSTLHALARSIRTLQRIARDEQVNVIFTNTLAIPYGDPLARSLGIPHIWHVHEHIADEPIIFQRALRSLVRASRGTIIANSRSVALALAGGDPRLDERIHVIPNGVDTATFSRGERNANQTPVIGVVGRLSPRKGTHEAIRAAALLKAHGYRFTLRFVGAPPVDRPELLDFYRREVEAYQLSAYVEFKGEVTHPAAAYHGLDIALLPSQRPEPFGLVVIEAMATGLPVLATRNGGGSDEILQHEINGLYCGRRPTEIARGLEQLLTDPELAAGLGRRARYEARERYDIADYRCRMRALLADALEH